MKIISIKEYNLSTALKVVDCKVDNGYRQGIGRQLADVDIDFQSDRRQEVKEYLEKRYNTGGVQRVFSAGTFSSLKLKAALKDVARVYRIPINLVNYITAIFEDDNMGWTELFKLAATNKKVRKFILDYPEVIEDIRTIMGQPRSSSVHASAIIITPDTKDGNRAECFDFLPIKRMDGILVSELDGYSIDEIGLLKNDCLGIKELTKIHTIINLCNDNYGSNISFEQIVRSRMDDEKAYELLSKGFTQSVFQLSSRGMTRFLMDMQPENINDLIAANALFRPATLESGSTEKYLLHKRGDIAPIYLWGTYNAMKETYAQLVYQEQLAQISREVGGFSLAEGIKLLKLISKKKTADIHAMRGKFIDGAAQKGCPAEDAVKIWDMIEAGGSYIFNKSHATAYAITSYCGAWLKANYPTAFYTVALQWCDDKEIPLLMSEMELCSEAKIVAPDINVSEIEFFTDYASNEIFWSLTRIKMLGVKAVEYIITEREKNGAFSSIENFIHRIFKYKLKKYQYWDDPEDESEATRIPVNSRHVRHLILSGCFDKVEGIRSINERYHILEKAGKELGMASDANEFYRQNYEIDHFWSIQQINISGIGQIDYRRVYDNSEAKEKIRGKASYMPLRDALILENEGKRIAVCATVVEVDEISYKDKTSGEKKQFCKLKLQQNNDLMELVCWNEFYLENKELIQSLKDRMIIASSVIKYSDYTSSNNLNTYKTSLLFKL